MPEISEGSQPLSHGELVAQIKELQAQIDHGNISDPGEADRVAKRLQGLQQLLEEKPPHTIH